MRYALNPTGMRPSWRVNFEPILMKKGSILVHRSSSLMHSKRREWSFMIPASRLFALWMIHVRKKFWLGELKPNSLQASKRFCAPNDQAVFTPLSTRWVP